MRWRVIGLDRETGEPRDVSYFGTHEYQIRSQAEAGRIVVETVSPYPSPPSSAVFVVVAWLFITCGIFAFVAAIVAITDGWNARIGETPAELAIRQIAATAAAWTHGVRGGACIAIGVVIYLLSTLADIVWATWRRIHHTNSQP